MVDAGLAAELARAADAEAALSTVTGAVFARLGDREAHLRPGALKDGERQFFIAGIFLVLPEAAGHILVAEQGFPPEQHRLRIPIDIGHPGHVWQTKAPLILANTDAHPEFRQILKTARMGSALYAPLLWQGRMLGQLIMAAQARNTFSDPDLAALIAHADLASLAFMAHDGPGFLAGL